MDKKSFTLPVTKIHKIYMGTYKKCRPRVFATFSVLFRGFYQTLATIIEKKKIKIWKKKQKFEQKKYNLKNMKKNWKWKFEKNKKKWKLDKTKWKFEKKMKIW